MALDFRRLNVEEDEVLDFLPEQPPAPSNQEIQAVAAEVRGQMGQGNNRAALQALLSHTPHRQHMDAAVEVFSSTRTGEIAAMVKGVDVDGLVRYLFWAMERVGEGKANGGVVLGWLEKVIEMEGNGSIVRCMTDRRFS